MRYFYWLILVICFALPSKAEPYTAFITADGVAVRSGPGIDFYPVLQLHTGDEVEVYYEQEGWCAVRPPIGSFSWVSAKFIAFDSGNIGTVLTDGLASRIGSDYSDDCETVQVTLKKGETILILERRETPENPVSPVWLKIAPPSGEFRWIHRSALRTSAHVQQVQYNIMTAEIPELPKIAQPEQSILVPKIASAHPFAAVLKDMSSIDPFQKAFDELQREAYIVMTRPTDDEVFAVLIQRADELHQVASTDQDLEKTYHLLESLQRTRAVRRELGLRRPATIGTNPSRMTLNLKTAATKTSGTPVQQNSIITAYIPTSAQNDLTSIRAGINVGGYDIVGRLGEFDPLPKGHPPYAVVDEKEQIICLISPSANLDLSQYVGQFVGINGILGFYEKPGKPRSRHVSVQNIRSIQ